MGILYMVLAAFGFALMGLCVKQLDHLPAIELVFFRSLVAVSLSYLMIRRAQIPVFGTHYKLLLLRGLLGTAGLTLFFIAIKELPLGMAVTLNYLSPIFTIIGTWILLNERIRPIQWLFLAIAFGGVYYLNANTSYFTWSSLLIGISSAVFAGTAYALVRLLSTKEASITIVFYFPLVATPISLIWALTHWTQPDWEDLPYIFGMGLLAQVAQVLMTKAYKLSAANLVATASYSAILFSMLVEILFLHAIYQPDAWIGIGMILSGIVLNTILFGRKKPKVS